MRKTNNNIVIILSLLTVLSSSCGRNTLYSDTVKMPGAKWSMYDPGKFACHINDTTGSFNISFSVRTSTEYPYRNLYMFIVTTFPSGSSMTDTLQGRLATPEGKWLGKGAGDIREITIPYKSNVFFPESGEYHFKVIHGMRDTTLEGVYDIGMKIAKRTK